uniref:ATP synthase F0 subunit 8 n=1 Tax=Arctonoe vittata TaxID=862921 RepID=A0A8F2F712_9ANNE|nr:ATP synthase F0 subunit 8 [Arctonoe vittata]
MPHLSPLNWLLAPMLFWFLLMSFSSILWWSQLPVLPKFSSSLNKINSSNWSW